MNDIKKFRSIPKYRRNITKIIEYTMAYFQKTLRKVYRWEEFSPILGILEYWEFFDLNESITRYDAILMYIVYYDQAWQKERTVVHQITIRCLN